MNKEHDKMATMDVDAVVIDPDAQCPEHGCARAACDDAHHIDDVDTSATSDGVPSEVDPHRTPTGPTQDERRRLASDLVAELAKSMTPAYPPGWNPAHLPGLAHPSDVVRAGSGVDTRAGEFVPPSDYSVPLVAPVPSSAKSPSLDAQQARYVSHESACESVRSEVTLPTMPAGYESTAELRGLLRVAQSCAEKWANLGDTVLGDVCHAAPGVHAAVINTTSFASQALELIERATSRPAEWVATFEAIVASASRNRAWRLLGLASSALLAGPFTPLWNNAVDWCVEFWSER